MATKAGAKLKPFKLLECWIDGGRPSTRAKAQDKAKDIARSGIKHAMIILNNHSNPDIGPHISLWKNEHLAMFCDELRAAGVPLVSLTPWPIATEQGIAEFKADLARVAEGLARHRIDPGTIGINPDLEGKWNWRGWGSDGERLMGALVDAIRQSGFSAELSSFTCVPFKKEPRPQDLAAAESGFFKRAQPQTYSQFQGPDHWSANSFFRPGEIQRHTARVWRDIPAMAKVGGFSLGLMVSHQGHPAPHPQGVDAVRTSLEAGAAMDFYDRVAIWSWRWFASRPEMWDLMRDYCGDGAGDGQAPVMPERPYDLSLLDGAMKMVAGQADAIENAAGKSITKADFQDGWRLKE